MRTAAALTIIAALALNCLGCGGKVTKTARGTATAFITYMKAGKYQQAAELWDYDALGRAGNSDWDTFSPGQRELIIKESRWVEDKATSMQRWSSRFVTKVKVTAVAEEGETAIATIEGGGISSLDLVKVGEEWRISAIN
jgi:hypothetical protein